MKKGVLFVISCLCLVIIQEICEAKIGDDMKKGVLFIVSGPSGVGKTCIVNEALKRLRDEDYDMARVVTYTSRPKRPKEVDGIDYNFISREDFEQKIRDDFFLEFSKHINHFYGSPKIIDGNLNLGKSFILTVNIEGVRNAKKTYYDSVSIWIDPPDANVLRNRLLGRNDCGKEEIERRLEKAKEEIEQAHKNRLFKYFLVNDVFEQSVNEFMMLVKKFI